MTDHTALADRYIEMWNETDPARRRAIIARTWAEDGRYVDPLQSGDGPAGIDAMVQALQERFPGHRFRRTSDVDAHNGAVRFSWEMAPEDGEALAAGVDFGLLAEDGRLHTLTGFIDHLLALPQAG